MTKEGGSQYKGRVEFTSDQLNESPYHTANALALDQWGIDSSGNLLERLGSNNTLIRDIPSAYQKQTLSGTPGLFPDINFSWAAFYSIQWTGSFYFEIKLLYNRKDIGSLGSNAMGI